MVDKVIYGLTFITLVSFAWSLREIFRKSAPHAVTIVLWLLVTLVFLVVLTGITPAKNMEVAIVGAVAGGLTHGTNLFRFARFRTRADRS